MFTSQSIFFVFKLKSFDILVADIEIAQHVEIRQMCKTQVPGFHAKRRNSLEHGWLKLIKVLCLTS